MVFLKLYCHKQPRRNCPPARDLQEVAEEQCDEGSERQCRQEPPHTDPFEGDRDHDGLPHLRSENYFFIHLEQKTLEETEDHK